MVEQYRLAELIVTLSREPADPPSAWLAETLRLIKERE
jgi:hypothetical protein